MINSGPSNTNDVFSSINIPHSLAIALAVILLSPVTILTLIPAVLQLATAPGTSGLKISLIPIIAINIKFDVSISYTPLSFLLDKSSFPLSSLYAKPIVLNDYDAINSIPYSIFYLSSESIEITPYSLEYNLLHPSNIISLAPFVTNLLLIIMLILFLLLENGIFILATCDSLSFS